jgi:glycosyltransferase involved in cell wall biosynthesis
MIKILHITPDFNYSCGVSKLVYLSLSYFDKRDDFECHFITNGGDSLERLNSLKRTKVQIIKFSKGIKNIFFVNSFYKSLKDFVVKNEIEVIHSYHRFPEFISAKVGHETKIKTISTILSFVKGYKKLSFKSDHLITVSNAITSHLMNKFRVEPKKISTIYLPKESFIEYEDVCLKQDLGIEQNQKVLLYMGRINFIKNIDTLLQAYSIVHTQNANAVLVLCGSLESDQIIEQINMVKDPIIVLKPREKNYLLYNIADLVVLPSRVDPFPFVMIEAGSFKKPFIGGNTGGIAEFIEDGKNGLLVDPESPEQLAEKIIYLLDNPDIAKILGENLYEKVNRLCGYNNYFNEIEKIYNSLLESE